MPATVNSPESSMMRDVMLRMKALSSTTRTRGLLEDMRASPQGAHFDAAVFHEQVDAAPVIAARVLTDDRHARLGEGAADRRHVPFADVHSAVRHERGEHARAADDLGANTDRKS